MRELFLHLVNMSIAASWLILAVIVYRIIFKKAPKCIATMLWCLVGLRLICPITIESRFSVIPSENTIVVEENNLVIETGVTGVDSTINTYLEGARHETVDVPENDMGKTFVIIWMLGALLLFGCSLISYVRLRRSIRDAVRYSDRVFQSEKIDSPFVLGIFKPVIYMTYGLSEEQIDYVIQHERAHVKRKDHLIKPFGFLILCVYWFHPLVWVAYILLCRDIELACDEHVIKKIGYDKKKMYSQTLLDCSISRQWIKACPVAFAEVGVKERVLNIMRLKKAKKSIVALASVSFVALTVMFMTKPFDDKGTNDKATQIIYSESAEAELISSEVQSTEEKIDEETKIEQTPAEKNDEEQTSEETNSGSTNIEITEVQTTEQDNQEDVITEEKKESSVAETTEAETTEAEVAQENTESTNPAVVSVKLINPVAGGSFIGRVYSSEHEAIDYVAPQGTPLLAAVDGTVIEVGNNDSNGNYLVIKASDGTTVYYNHCDSILVQNGASVSAGSDVAVLGSTGDSSGPHLHFAVADANGYFIDPLSIMQ